MILPAEITARAEGFAGRGWVAREVADWLDRGTERFLVVTGEPGSGKTAIAAWFAGAGPVPAGKADATALRRIRRSWTAMHFCIPRRGGTVDGEAFATSIAGQLADRLAPDYLPAVATANNVVLTGTVKAGIVKGTAIGVNIAELVIAAQSRADTAANVSALWQGAVRSPLQELGKIPPGPTAAILVDALDEAARVPRPNIVTLVAGSADFPPGVRFLVTTSTDLDARAVFPAARIVDLSSPASQADADEDVRAFVRATLAPSPEAEDRLVEAAAGNFLYVRFLVDEVRRGQRSLDSLEGLPGGLYTLYNEYLDRLTGTSPGGAPGTAWERGLQPLLGCISVATPSAPRALLPSWIRKDAGRVSRLLDETRQVIEPDESPDGPGHRLYHRSMSDFLAAAQYGTNGAQRDNPYHTPPEAQHARIAQHYVRNFKGTDWGQADAYGLRHVVHHLAAAAAAEALPVERRRLAADLYRTALDSDFQAAQKAILGDLHSTLRDLRTAIETALAGEEMVPLLRCIAAYREVARSGAIAQGIFAAVDRGDFRAASRDAEHYGPPPRPRGRWARVLDAWIAWQAARAGRLEDAEAAASGVVGQWLTPALEAEPLYWELCRALIVRAGRTILAGGGDPDALLRVFPDHHSQLTVDVHGPPPAPLSAADRAQLQGALAGHLGELESQLRQDPYEAIEAPFTDPEFEAARATTLRDVLRRLAAEPEGQAGIDRILRPTLSNPYPRYRDIGLIAIGTAVVAVPDDTWVDDRLRSILLAGLDTEGVTFTFDLPTLLLSEANRRKRPVAGLATYLDQARQQVASPDRWGTGMRVLSAEASSLAAQGDRDAARAALVGASRQPVGFAGYASTAYLSLASRCVELGAIDAATQATWGPQEDRTFVDLAGERAWRVRDREFRDERLRLVESYDAWLREPSPDLRAVQAFVAVTPDPDARRAYKDLASARWSVAGTPESRDWLKALVPMVLEDTTTLDAILARVVRPKLAGLTDRELAEAMDVVATGLTAGRPWDLFISDDFVG